MALIVCGRSECVVCGGVLTDAAEIVGTPHFATGPDDPLWRYTDAPFHRACYEGLPERDEIEARVGELHGRQAESKRAIEAALLRAWRQATDTGFTRLPLNTDWVEEFAWVGMGHRVERGGWEFTNFGIKTAEALDAAERIGEV